MGKLTVKAVRAIKAGEWLSDGGARGAGTLLFRRTGGGVTLAYFRYTKPDGKRDTYAIGHFDPDGRDGLTLAQVREKAGELSRLYQSGVRDIRAHFAEQEAEERAEKEARQAAQEAAQREAEARGRYTLQALCEAYIGHLEQRGKAKSARDGGSIFRVHVFRAHPALSSTSAAEITPRDAAEIIRKVREAGKDRTAGVLRSYLRAAYALAIRAEVDSEAPSELIPFGVQVNPIDAVPAIPVEAGQRTLSESELRAYVEHLGDGLIDQALRLALLAGGQRMAQLLRATVGDWDTQSRTLRLWDTKGKRRSAREHLLPLGPEGAALVERLIERAREKAVEAAQEGQRPDPNPSLWLSRGGAVVVESTPGKRVVDIAREMNGSPFNLRDIRRTVETQLARMGVSRETRAQLLSHGLGGLQNVHYNRHDYATEKHRALEAWEQHLAHLAEGERAPSNVTPLRSAGVA